MSSYIKTFLRLLFSYKSRWFILPSSLQSELFIDCLPDSNRFLLCHECAHPSFPPSFSSKYNLTMRQIPFSSRAMEFPPITQFTILLILHYNLHKLEILQSSTKVACVIWCACEISINESFNLLSSIISLQIKKRHQLVFSSISCL